MRKTLCFLSGLTAISLLTMLPSQVFASTSHSSNPVVSSLISENSGVLYTPHKYTKPNAPIKFTLSKTSSVLSSLGLKEDNNHLVSSGSNNSDSFGVLLIHGSHYTLATLNNGMISLSVHDKSVTIRADHSNFKRYSTYSAYLVTGSLYQMVNAFLKFPLPRHTVGVNWTTVTPNYFGNGIGTDLSNVYPILGVYMHTLESKGIINGFSFKTGSAIGESTHLSYTLSSRQINVNSNGEIDFTVTDDYNDPATNATLTINGYKHGTSTPSSSFTSSSGVAITDGTASVLFSDTKAEPVTVKYSVKDNTYKSKVDTQSGTIHESFIR